MSPLSSEQVPASVVFSPTLPWRDANLASPAVSPDGRRIAFIARDRGDEIVVRSLDALQAQPLKGTAGARTGATLGPEERANYLEFPGECRFLEK